MSAANSRANDSLNLSMRDKSLHKRRVNKEHNSNFRAGYVHINEEQLHKTGLRGRKRYVLYILLAVLVLVAFGNLLVTILVLGILRIDHTGMESLELISYGKLLRFVGEATFVSMIVPGHSIASHGDKNIQISADITDIKLSVPDQGLVHLASGVTTVTSDEGLSVVDPTTGQQIFTTQTGIENVHIPDNLKYLDIQTAEMSKISSGIGDDLRLESDVAVSIRGNEGILADGKTADIDAKESLELSGNSLVFDGSDGVYLEQHKKFPYTANSLLSSDVSTHRVCVCMPSGKLFLVPSEYKCSQANEEKNPCL